MERNSMSLASQAAHNWPTTSARDYKGESGAGRQERKGHPTDTLPNAIAAWPTACTRDYKGMNGLESTLNKLENGERGHMGQLPNAVMVEQHRSGLPAPENRSTNGNRRESWGTPRETMSRDKQEGSGKHKLGEQVQNNSGAKLNPRWVETLMGLPIGWTMPSCTSPVTIEPMNSGCWAMESCLNVPPEHGKCCMQG